MFDVLTALGYATNNSINDHCKDPDCGDKFDKKDVTLRVRFKSQAGQMKCHW